MSIGIEQAYRTLGNFSPNQMQRRVWEEFSGQHSDDFESPAFLLQAFTGSGKTEAIVFPSLVFKHRLVLVLPTRSLVDDLTALDLESSSRPLGRLHHYLKVWSNEDSRQRTLIVDTGTRMERTVYYKGKQIHPRSGEKIVKDRSHLYRGDIIVTTLDKFIYRFFGFAWGRKSYIYPLRISRQKTLVCFDEAHSYEATAFTNFRHLVTALYEKGVGVVSMTATLPEPFRNRLDFLRVQGVDGSPEWLDFTTNQAAKSQFFPKQIIHISDPEKTSEKDEDSREKQREWRIHQLTTLAMERWRERPTRLIVAMESVRGAVGVYCQLKAAGLQEVIPQKNLFLYHGRLDSKQRTLIYQRLKDIDRGLSTSPYILVTTAAIEVGCDLNAEVLLTEICGPDSLVQRSGRCNRRGDFNTTAEIIVVGNSIPQHALSLVPEQEKAYLALLQKKTGSVMTPGFITQLLNCLKQPPLFDPRASTAFEMLYEYVYEFALENQPLYERGFIATRSWEPAIPLVIKSDDDGEAEITVEVSWLVGKIQESPKGIVVEEWKWEEDSRKWHWTPIQKRGGSLYEREIRVNVSDPNVCGYTPELGFVDLPKVFSHASRRGEYEVRIGYFLPDESKTDSDGGVFVDASAKKAKRPDVFFRYLSDPKLLELGSEAENLPSENAGKSPHIEERA